MDGPPLAVRLHGDRQKAFSWMTPEATETCRRDFIYSWWVACAYVMLAMPRARSTGWRTPSKLAS